MNVLQANNVNALPWLSRSPDMAPIDHVLDMLNIQIALPYVP